MRIAGAKGERRNPAGCWIRSKSVMGNSSIWQRPNKKACRVVVCLRLLRLLPSLLLTPMPCPYDAPSPIPITANQFPSLASHRGSSLLRSSYCVSKSYIEFQLKACQRGQSGACHSPNFMDGPYESSRCLVQSNISQDPTVEF